MELAHEWIVGGLADRRLADMSAERTEMARQPDLVVEADHLVAEENHLKACEGIMQLGDLLVRERLGQIDIADFGADMRTGRCDRDGLVGHAGTYRSCGE